MVDLMRHLQVDVSCPECTEAYPVSVETVRECQRLVCEGCPGTSSYECPARYFAGLLAPAAVARLVEALQGLEDDARLHGGRRVRIALPPPELKTAASALRETEALEAAIVGWENEGGATRR